jgi:hypothetical protein
MFYTCEESSCEASIKKLKKKGVEIKKWYFYKHDLLGSGFCAIVPFSSPINLSGLNILPIPDFYPDTDDIAKEIKNRIESLSPCIVLRIPWVDRPFFKINWNTDFLIIPKTIKENKKKQAIIDLCNPVPFEEYIDNIKNRIKRKDITGYTLKTIAYGKNESLCFEGLFIVK